MRQHLCRKRLARSAFPGEEPTHAQTAPSLGCKTPYFVHLHPTANLRCNLSQCQRLRLRQNQVVPPRVRRDTLRQIPELRACQRTACIPQLVRSMLSCHRSGSLNRARTQAELARKAVSQSIEALCLWPNRLLPEPLLLRRQRLVHFISQKLAAQLKRIATRKKNMPGNPFQEPFCKP